MMLPGFIEVLDILGVHDLDPSSSYYVSSVEAAAGLLEAHGLNWESLKAKILR